MILTTVIGTNWRNQSQTLDPWQLLQF